MALRNAFEDLATEKTLDKIRVEQVTEDRALLHAILYELKILNVRFEEAFRTGIKKEDIE